MHNDGPPPQRVAYDRQIRVGSGWFGRLLAVIVDAIVLVGAAMLSVILLAVLFAVGAIVAGYLWWSCSTVKNGSKYPSGAFIEAAAVANQSQALREAMRAIGARAQGSGNNVR